VAHICYVDGGSYLQAPSSQPSYPVPELAAGILLAAGLAGIAAFFVVRRKRTGSEI
jgi:hypothetical protein